MHLIQNAAGNFAEKRLEASKFSHFVVTIWPNRTKTAQNARYKSSTMLKQNISFPNSNLKAMCSRQKKWHTALSLSWCHKQYKGHGQFRCEWIKNIKSLKLLYLLFSLLFLFMCFFHIICNKLHFIYTFQKYHAQPHA